MGVESTGAPAQPLVPGAEQDAILRSITDTIADKGFLLSNVDKLVNWARTGSLYTRRGKISIKQARYREDPEPIDPDCTCPVCRHYTRAYLSHLFRSGEILAMRLNTLHNLHFYQRIMREAREAIVAGHFDEHRREFLAAYSGEGSNPVETSGS